MQLSTKKKKELGASIMPARCGKRLKGQQCLRRKSVMRAKTMAKKHSRVSSLPRCHRCGKPAEAVYQNEYWTYSYNEDTGKYDSSLVDMEIRCPFCNAKLWDEFPDGVCNYSIMKTWIKDDQT
jgi:DNA-directed RNA polymerase subunit RPC12/RpoP